MADFLVTLDGGYLLALDNGKIQLLDQTVELPSYGSRQSSPQSVLRGSKRYHGQVLAAGSGVTVAPAKSGLLLRVVAFKVNANSTLLTSKVRFKSGGVAGAVICPWVSVNAAQKWQREIRPMSIGWFETLGGESLYIETFTGVDYTYDLWVIEEG